MTSASNVGKALGWAQFAVNAATQVLSNGLPTNAAGWAGLIGSFLAAIGIHAASSTDGAK